MRYSIQLLDWIDPENGEYSPGLITTLKQIASIMFYFFQVAIGFVIGFYISRWIRRIWW